MDWLLSLDLGREAVYALMGAAICGIVGQLRRRKLMKGLAKLRASLDAAQRENRELLTEVAERVALLDDGGQLACELLERARRQHSEQSQARRRLATARAREIGRARDQARAPQALARLPWWKRALLRVRRK